MRQRKKDGHSPPISEIPVTRLDAIGEDEVICEFFGQLWAVDSPPPPGEPRVRAAFSRPTKSSLFWVRKEVIEQNLISPTDCFPIGRADRFDKPPVKISFTRDVWGQGGAKETYAEVAKGSMEEEG